MPRTLGLGPRSLSGRGPGRILFYALWLLPLPLFGALGAYISLRAGGSARAILFSGIFPMLSLAACFFVILPLSIVLDRSIAFHLTLAGFLGLLLSWVVAPGATLLIGALPIQILHAREVNSQRVAGARPKRPGPDWGEFVRAKIPRLAVQAPEN